VVGEFQPRLQDGTPDGPPIPNYFPPAVTEAEWYAARAASTQRKRKAGRTSGDHVNPFAGLLIEARTGCPYYSCRRNGRGSKGYHRVLFNATAHAGESNYYSFPFDPFEECLLRFLSEINPREVLGQDEGPDEVLELSAELAGVEARLAEVEGQLVEGGNITTLAKAARQLEAKKADLAARLGEARQKAAHPLSEGWGEAGSIITALNSAPDQREARLRLRAILRRVIDRIVLLVVPRGGDRLCVAQVEFQAEGGHGQRRDYLIVHRQAARNAAAARPAQTGARSLKIRHGRSFKPVSDPAMLKYLEKELAVLEYEFNPEAEGGLVIHGPATWHAWSQEEPA